MIWSVQLGLFPFWHRKGGLSFGSPCKSDFWVNFSKKVTIFGILCPQSEDPLFRVSNFTGRNNQTPWQFLPRGVAGKAEGKITPRNGVRVWDFLNFLFLNFWIFRVFLDFGFLGLYWDFWDFLGFSKGEITAQSEERDKDFGDLFEIIWNFGTFFRISEISLGFMGVMGFLFDFIRFLVLFLIFGILLRTFVIYGISFRIPWSFGIFWDFSDFWDFWNFWDFLIF